MSETVKPKGTSVPANITGWGYHDAQSTPQHRGSD